MTAKDCRAPISRRMKPYAFIAGFGTVSMFMDVVYQAALSVQGPLLASLGASALFVGIISGLGEATSLAGRLFSGPLADRTGRYWTFAILGYAATGLAVPAMGFAGSLGAVAFLVVFERFGKSLRTPSRDAMLSHAAGAVGRGKGFALHEVMDQIGAIGGPLAAAAVLSVTTGDYRVALGMMIVPAFIAIATLLVLRYRVPDPCIYEPEQLQVADLPSDSKTAGKSQPDSKKRVNGADAASHPNTGMQPCKAATPARAEIARQLPGLFWLYTAACGIMLAGVATFGVVSFHIVNAGLAGDALVPVVYAGTMGVDALFAALTGILYDRLGTRVLLVLPFICAAIPLFAYADDIRVVLAGVILWGASLGIQESTMRAAVGDMVPPRQRAGAYGFFSMAVGIGSLVGGVAAGALYDRGPSLLIVYAMVVETAAFVLLWRALHTSKELRG